MKDAFYKNQISSCLSTEVSHSVTLFSKKKKNCVLGQLFGKFATYFALYELMREEFNSILPK